MALTTDQWVGTASADWGAAAANWSSGFPTKNSNVEISTPSVLTVTYGYGDDFTVHSLVVGNDVFDMSGGSSLTITTTASFADGFTQTGGTLTAGGAVTVDGTGTLTGGAAEDKTHFVFDGSVALGSYTLGGATVFSNKKTTNLTNGITLGDNTGVNATIDNEKGGTFEIGGYYGIDQGAASARFINAGTLTLEKIAAGDTSSIDVDLIDTGRIVVEAGTLEFDGTKNRFAGTISGAGTFALGEDSNNLIENGATITAAVFTLDDNNTTFDGNLVYAGTFTAAGGNLDLADVTVTLSGTDTFENYAVLEGSGVLVTAHGDATSVSDFDVGGGITWENSGTVSDVGGVVTTFEFGDTTFNPAIFINEKGGIFDFAAAGGSIASGAALNSSFINMAGALLEETGGDTSYSNVVGVDVFDSGAIVVQAGILDFAGVTNGFAGKISGAGEFEISGGDSVIGKGATITTAIFEISSNYTLVTLGEPLRYAGTFDFENFSLMNLGGFTLSLSGNDTFDGPYIYGTGALITGNGSTVSVDGFTLGGAVHWQNAGTVGDSGGLTIGDGTFDVATFINEKGGVFDFVVANVGIAVGANPTSSFINETGAVVENTSSGDSEIFADFTNNGSVAAKTGTIEFATFVGGDGGFTIDPGATLEFAAGVAKSLTVDFVTKTGGDLMLLDSGGFNAAIRGFGGTSTDEIELADFSGPVTLHYRGNAKGGVLTVANGTETAELTFLGKYTIGDFHASAGPNGSTLIVDPTTHTLLASAH
jgi:hypothetical protein